MSLTPLHFPQGVADDGQLSPIYGVATYHTDCGRFRLYGFGDSWELDGLEITWWQWLKDHELLHVKFPTRREALEALDSYLQAEN